jgi:hypothetical protein
MARSKKKYGAFEVWAQAVETKASAKSGGIFDFRAVTFPWSELFMKGDSIEDCAEELVSCAYREADQIMNQRYVLFADGSLK